METGAIALVVGDAFGPRELCMSEIARGLEGIVVTETRMSLVDGLSGRLVVAGIPIEELAPNATFEESFFLLLNGRFPSEAEIASVRDQLERGGILSGLTIQVLRAAASANVGAMDALRMGLSTIDLGAPEVSLADLQRESRSANHDRAFRIAGAVPAIVGAYYRLGRGESVLEPVRNLGYVANYLYLLSGEVPTKARERALATYLNTTIDHGMNASTFTARVIASTRSDMLSAVIGALGALKGPLHGGAPGPALEMVKELQAERERTGRSIEELAEERVRREVAAGGRIMGFGHRVYRVRDPRADVLGAALTRLAAEEGEPRLYGDARAVEQVVLRVLAELKPHRALHTNVEFYTALLLEALGMPTPLFTPTFAVARVAGWLAHLLEQVGEDRLIRPSCKYVAATNGQWIPLSERASSGVGTPPESPRSAEAYAE